MNEENSKNLEIKRDNTFVRIIADDCFVADMGRSLEIGLIQYGPIFKNYSEDGKHETVTNQSVLTEVARLRIDYSTAIKMFLKVIESGVKNDTLKIDGLLSAINSMKDIRGE